MTVELTDEETQAAAGLVLRCMEEFGTTVSDLTDAEFKLVRKVCSQKQWNELIDEAIRDATERFRRNLEDEVERLNNQRTTGMY